MPRTAERLCGGSRRGRGRADGEWHHHPCGSPHPAFPTLAGFRGPKSRSEPARLASPGNRGHRSSSNKTSWEAKKAPGHHDPGPLTPYWTDPFTAPYECRLGNTLRSFFLARWMCWRRVAGLRLVALPRRRARSSARSARESDRKNFRRSGGGSWSSIVHHGSSFWRRWWPSSAFEMASAKRLRATAYTLRPGLGGSCRRVSITPGRCVSRSLANSFPRASGESSGERPRRRAELA